MDQVKSKRSAKGVWIISGAVLAVVVCGCAFIIKLVLSDAGPQRKNHVSTVNLLKPPPPPPPKEKPPEPEPEIKQTKMKEHIIEAGPESPKDTKPDDKQARNQLGVDAEGSAGGDRFGLVGNKGGAGLIGGGGGGGGTGSGKYGWYTKSVEDEVSRKVRKKLEENGGAPKGKLQTVVHISLDPRGKIVDCRIVASSGDSKMDNAVEEALKFNVVSQPPQGMKGLSIKISSQG